MHYCRFKKKIASACIRNIMHPALYGNKAPLEYGPSNTAEL